jgi:hypothetical protein
MNTPLQTTDKPLISPVILFAGTLFISAMLMFALQPMFGKLLLPLLGGTPAVWNTCMVFYQTFIRRLFVCPFANNSLRQSAANSNTYGIDDL